MINPPFIIMVEDTPKKDVVKRFVEDCFKKLWESTGFWLNRKYLDETLVEHGSLSYYLKELEENDIISRNSLDLLDNLHSYDMKRKLHYDVWIVEKDLISEDKAVYGLYNPILKDGKLVESNWNGIIVTQKPYSFNPREIYTLKATIYHFLVHLLGKEKDCTNVYCIMNSFNHFYDEKNFKKVVARNEEIYNHNFHRLCEDCHKELKSNLRKWEREL